MDKLFKLVRRFAGISWRHPLTSRLLALVNPVDSAVRRTKGLGYLPPYTVRIRSTGMKGEFGGEKFISQAKTFASFLQQEVGLQPQVNVLEVGCGCGRIALGLVGELNEGNYTGADIDPISLQACRDNARLSERQFQFVLMDVRNSIYNPTGNSSPESYVFPFPDESFDVVFLYSVFTHMLPEAVDNYLSQIGRVLRPSGRLAFSTFLLDSGYEGADISFPVDRGHYRLLTAAIPEKAVGFKLAYLDDLARRYDLHRDREPLWGQWRHGADADMLMNSVISQDILLYNKS